MTVIDDFQNIISTQTGEIYTYPCSLSFRLSLVLSHHFLFEQLNQDLRSEHDHHHLKEDFLVSYLYKKIKSIDREFQYHHNHCRC